MLIIRHGVYNFVQPEGESEFEIRDADWEEENLVTTVKVHPWIRHGGEDRQVYLEVGFQEPAGEGYHNIIVDREEFVTGLIEVFPELRRA